MMQKQKKKEEILMSISGLLEKMNHFEMDINRIPQLDTSSPEAIEAAQNGLKRYEDNSPIVVVVRMWNE